MKQNTAYTNLAKWFEYLNDDCDYEKWSQYLIMKLNAYPLKNGLDIGCGGGWFTRAFQKHGYQMTGMDISAEMLNFAQETAMKSGIRSEYILGDITAKKLQKHFDFATAINDCINYIPKDKLDKALKNVYASLSVGGVFLFDISSRRKFEKKIADTVCADDREDITYLSFNTKNGDEVSMDVTLFCKRPDGAFDRLDEKHLQYIYDEEEIISALIRCGFTPVLVEGHLGEDKNSSDRICFLAKKESKK